MRRLFKAALIAWTTLGTLPVAAQPKPPEPPRAAGSFDAVAVRRQAAQLAEFRALLSDPDPNVRLLVIREAIRAGDAAQRQLAIEAGLASNESALLDVALRGVLANSQQIILDLVDGEGNLLTGKDAGTFRLSITKFDQDDGKLEGTSSCRSGVGKWTGQLQGLVIAFNTADHVCSGNLIWNAEKGLFVGRASYPLDTIAIRNIVWRPR